MGLEEPEARTRQALLRSLLLVAGCALLVGVLHSGEWGLGLALGGAISAWNLAGLARMLARGLDAARSDAERGRQSAKISLKSGLRLPLSALALVLILWYMPARPEALLAGFTLALAATAYFSRPSSNPASPET